MKGSLLKSLKNTSEQVHFHQHMKGFLLKSLKNTSEQVHFDQHMKGFLLKSLKNTSEQVHFYQYCETVICALTKQRIFQVFPHRIVTRTFWSSSKKLLLNQAAQLQDKIESSAVHFLAI